LPITFTKNYLAWRSVTMAKRITGKAYQKKAPTARGETRPEVTPHEPAE